MEPNTHPRIDTSLSGEVVQVDEGEAVVELHALEAMRVDDEGLVHGGFVFGAADHAAMLAINHPLVVLGGATCRFKAPVRVGETVRLHARQVEGDARRQQVEVSGTVGERKVFEGTFTTFVLDRHVLDTGT